MINSQLKPEKRLQDRQVLKCTAQIGKVFTQIYPRNVSFVQLAFRG